MRDAPPAPPYPRSRRARQPTGAGCSDRAGVAGGRGGQGRRLWTWARARRSRALAEAGCRDFFVSTWAEAEALGPLPDGASLVVLHGVGPDDVDAALAVAARPVLNTAEQVARWKEIAPGRPCDVMVDTGMNRLGLRAGRDRRCSTGSTIDTLTAISPAPTRISAMNAVAAASAFARSPRRCRPGATASPIRAGICLGRDYGFDLVRPGLALYGGIPRDEAEGHIRQVARVEAQVVQRRTVRAGESCGYGATFVADARHRGGDPQHRLCRRLSARLLRRSGAAFAGEFALPLLGRVSMDLIAVDCDAAPDLSEGEWVELDYDLPTASEASPACRSMSC